MTTEQDFQSAKVSLFHLRVMLLQEVVEACEREGDDALPPIANLVRWGGICASIIATNQAIINSVAVSNNAIALADMGAKQVLQSFLICMERTRQCMRVGTEARSNGWVFDHLKMHLAKNEFTDALQDVSLMVGLSQYIGPEEVKSIKSMMATDDPNQISINALFKISDTITANLMTKYMASTEEQPSGKLH